MTKPFTPIVPKQQSVLYDEYKFAPAVRLGEQLIVSGIMGYNADYSLPDDLQGQLQNVFDRMESVLKEGGATLSDIASLTSYHTGDLAQDVATFIKIQSERLGAPHPAWTAVGVRQLASPGALIEVAAIAFKRG